MSRSDVCGASRRERIERLRLNPNAEKLLNKCRNGHTWYQTHCWRPYFTDPSGLVLQGNVTGQEVGDAVTWLVDEPLIAGMQDITDGVGVSAVTPKRCRRVALGGRYGAGEWSGGSPTESTFPRVGTRRLRRPPPSPHGCSWTMID